MTKDTNEAHGGSNGESKRSFPEEAYQTPPFLVAAVGASAGGIEAFSALISKLPADASLALILVQHLAREPVSVLPEILSRNTSLVVTHATDELKIEPSHVYIIPSDAHMTVIDGHVRLYPRPPGRGGTQIDVLFRSFAEFYREKAVGIVLSGGATDGAAGLREIKAVGGITIVQQPEDARIDSMPRAAIAAGAADMVLSVQDIAAELVRLSSLPLYREPISPPSADAEDRTAGEALVPVLHLLRRATGVDFGFYKRPTIQRRIARRMMLRRIASLDEYVVLLKSEPQEIENLYEDVLIHVTSFFRDQDSFAALAENVLPSMLRDAGEAPLRIWVPGCSTGEEVYSLAIVLFEALGEGAHSAALQIFGTDVSNKAVEAARLGVYPESIVADVGPERLRRFFTRVDSGYRISKTIRERCVFARQDITRDPPFSRLDLVVCRNMLIYLGQESQRKVMAVIHYALKPQGYLMLGRAESTGPGGDLFAIADKRFKIYVRKTGATSIRLDFSSKAQERSHVPIPHRAALRSSDVQLEADRVLMNRYAPPSIVLDAAFQILAVRGHTSDFLELPTGDASLDALKMVRSSLMVGLRAALDEARRTSVPVRKTKLPLLRERSTAFIDVEVVPLGGGEDRHYLVLFDEAPPVDAPSGTRAPEESSVAPASGVLDAVQLELANTREELRANIHDLAAANEELQSANEEILSSNEELQSTNEELDTAKEELQSTNEELSTLNEELRGRNDELTISNSDLNNLLASVQIPIVMVTDDLKIRRFTPAAERLLNLIPSDSGRPIGHINPNINFPDLDGLIAEVIQTVAPQEREVEGRDRRRYSLRIRPYKSVDNRIEGAVLALFDISTVRDALSAAEKTRDAVLATVRDPVLLLTPDLKIKRANDAYCTLFKATALELEGRFLYEVGGQAWDVPELRKLVEATASEKASFRDFSVQCEIPGVGPGSMLVDGTSIEPGGPDGLVVLVIRKEPGHVLH